MNNIIDISMISRMDRSRLRVYSLMDSQKIIGQETDDPSKVKFPQRILLRPLKDGQVSLELMDLLIGADPSEGYEITLGPNSVSYSYKPDDKLASGYADHMASITKTR